MADIQSKWKTKATVTITLTSIADAAVRQSAAITSHAGMGVNIRVLTKAAAANVGTCGVYVYTALGDTTYTGGASGADAAYTAAQYGNLEKLGDVTLAGTVAVSKTFSLGAAFGGAVPSRFGLVVLNESGGALSATAGDHVVEIEEVIATQVA